MKTRKLGRTKIELSEVGVGTWELSGDVWGAKDDRVSKRAILTGIETGATFIDTAAGYGAGHVEELIGQLFRSHELERSSVVVSTKIRPQNAKWTPPPNVPIEDAYDPRWLIEQLENSLRRLNTDYIDILFMHTWSKAWDHADEWASCLDELKQVGKIRAVGISVPDEGVSDANTHIEAGRVDAIQVVYNVFQQEPMYTLFPLARKHNVGIVARSPFSSGAVVQNWTHDMTFENGDWRAIWPLGVKPNWLAEQIEMTASVKPALGRAELVPNVAALRFVLDEPSVTSVIPGSGNPEHVKSNMGASEVSSLSRDIHEELRALWVAGQVRGTYNGSI